MRTTNRFRAMLSFVTAGMLGGSLGAFGGTTSDDYTESFEGYPAGSSVTSVVGSVWQASEPDASVIVSTNYTPDYVGVHYPLGDDRSGQSNVLQIVNGVTNTVEGGNPSQTNWVDMVLKPVLSDDVPELPPAGSVVGCYFNASSNLVVLYAPTWDTTAWLEIPDVSVGPDEWIRLSIAANMGAGDEFDDYARFYQIYINGTVVTNASAYQSPSSLSEMGGSWFASGASIVRTDPITNVVLKGTGYLDDLMFTNALAFEPPPPPAGPSFIQTFPSVGQLTYGQMLGDASLTGGTAIDSNDVVIAGDFMFVDPSIVPMVGTNDYDLSFTPSNMVAYLSTTGLVSVVAVHAPSYIATVAVSNQLTSGQMLSAAGVYGTATNAAGTTLPGQFAFVDPSFVPGTGTTSYAVSFTPDDTGYLTATGSVEVVTVSALTTTAIGTPTTWYDDLGITLGTNSYDNLDLQDTDGDGVLNWQEYLAGTHPTNGASVFEMVGLVFDGTNALVQWIGGTNGPTSSYVVESATSMTPPVVWVDMNNVEPRSNGTNDWQDSGAPARRWYRIRATGN